MNANILQEMRRLLDVSKEELSEKSGVTVEAQEYMEKYNAYDIPAEVMLPILRALDLPEEFMDDDELDPYSLEEYLVEHGRIKGREDEPFTAKDKKYEDFNREEQESIQYYMDEYGVSVEEAMFEVQYHNFMKPYSFDEIVKRFGVKVFN